MREFQAKHRLKKALYSWPMAVLLLVLVIIVGRSVWRVWQQERLVVADRDDLAQQVLALQARQAKLKQEVAALGTARGVEAAIREKFAVVKDGEGVITVIAPTATAPTNLKPWWSVFWPFNNPQ